MQTLFRYSSAKFPETFSGTPQQILTTSDVQVLRARSRGEHFAPRREPVLIGTRNVAGSFASTRTPGAETLKRFRQAFGAFHGRQHFCFVGFFQPPLIGGAVHVRYARCERFSLTASSFAAKGLWGGGGGVRSPARVVESRRHRTEELLDGPRCCRSEPDHSSV